MRMLAAITLSVALAGCQAVKTLAPKIKPMLQQTFPNGTPYLEVPLIQYRW